MNDMAFTGFWIFKPNLLPALLILSHLAGYDFGNDELDAVEYGLTGTSDKKDIWWTYQLIGSKKINLRFAYDEENTDIIFMQLSFDRELSAQIDMAVFILQDFDVQHRNWKQH